MTQILERLCKFEYITVVIMGEDVILNEPVENWPSCDCLISFHSKGKKSVAGLSRLEIWARELCPGFGWDRVNSLLSSWYSAVFWI